MENISEISEQSHQQQQNAFELDAQGEIAQPEMLPSDWIELIFLALLLLLGLPLNAVALSRQLGGSSASLFNPRKCSRISRQEVTRTNFLWLKLHLTIVDLLVILCYCPSQIAWLIGYTWSAGEFLCKAMQYSWDFCFHLMSFGVVSIALDRLRTVYGLMRMERTGKMARGSRQIRFVKRLIFLCYLGAALVSLPQWFVWTTIDLSTWSQCTTIWHKHRAMEYLQGREFTQSFLGERLYTLIHLLTVFWLPFLAISVAYAYIMVFLFYYSFRPCTTRCSAPVAAPTTSCYDQKQLLMMPNAATEGDKETTTAAMTAQYSSSNNMCNNGSKIINNSANNRSGVCMSANGEQHGAAGNRYNNNNHNDASNNNSSCNSQLSPRNLCISENSNCWSSSGGTCSTLFSSPPFLPVAPLLARSNGSKKQQHAGVPAWRLEMRSRIFQTTIHVIVAYLICWLPYNVLSLATFFSNDLQITISVHLELLRVCVLLNTLLNPFIYGFKRGQP